ncbi:MAG: hypothetical protein RL758_158 [Pseudomonadota bacterium]|jgi:DNA-binding phage protein
MNKAEAKAIVARIKNLTEFSRKSGVARRTLDRIKAGTVEPTRGTLALLSAGIAKIKPKLKEQEE